MTTARIETTEVRRPGGGYSISPGDLEFRNLQPNTNYSACLVITNYDTAGEDVDVDLTDADVRAGDTEADGVAVIDEPTGVGTWIRPADRVFVLGPSTQITVPYILRTPASVPAGTVVGGLKVNFSGTGLVKQSITQRIYVSGPGGRRARVELSRITSDRILRHSDSEAFHVHFSARNASDYLETFNATVSLRGLGRTVQSTRVTATTLLPDGKARLAGAMEEVPWIGIYRPTLKVTGRAGTVTKKLPWMVVLPPTPYVVALAVAIVLPIAVFAITWRRRRREWMQYLEDFDEDFAGDEPDGTEDDTYWDPHGPARP